MSSHCENGIDSVLYSQTWIVENLKSLFGLWFIIAVYWLLVRVIGVRTENQQP